jgi:hypothetical protein
MGEVWDNVKKNRGSERAEPPGEALSEAADEIALVLKWMRDNEPVTVSQVAEVLRNREGVNRIEAIRRARATPPPTAEAENAETIAWLQKVYAMGVSENSVVPQQNAGEMLARLDELGFGKQEPRRGNTLWAMVMDAADEVERLRAATAPTADHEPAWVDKAIEEIRSRWPNEVLNIDIQFSGYCYITRTLDGRVRAIAEGETLIAALTSARTEKGKPNAN